MSESKTLEILKSAKELYLVCDGVKIPLDLENAVTAEERERNQMCDNCFLARAEISFDTKGLRIPTITIENAVMRLRTLGMRISPVTLRRALEQKVFPFGLHIEAEKGKVYYIFEKQFNAWIEEMAVVDKMEESSRDENE